jgi:hypothetical protein
MMHCVAAAATAIFALHQSGVERLGQLRVLFLSNNKIRDWTEVDRLAALERLEDLLLVGAAGCFLWLPGGAESYKDLTGILGVKSY